MNERLKMTAKNIELTNEIASYIEKKLSKIDKYVRKISSIQVILEKIKYIYKVEILVYLPDDKIIKVNMEDKELIVCIEKAVDKLKDMILKYKEKNVSRKRNNKKYNELYENENLLIPSYEKKVLDIKLMDEKEAIEEFLKKKQDILIFLNKNTNKLSMVRTLKDNKIEIIELNNSIKE
ncbi:MAG: ribosome-associated translation inhibitor RaiA [Endomicrobia bacterium]|nr:ribosome-associated translation inhibitor RaiA [Endomicrobiia bacterium]